MIRYLRRFGTAVLALAVCGVGLQGAEAPVVKGRPLVWTLFDFEKGVTGWHGNPWGGGRAGAEASGDAKYGKGCLRGWYKDVKRGATVISPFFETDAAWKQYSWSGMSMYFRGDGSPAKVTLNLETDEKTHATYSASIALQDTKWHRVFIGFHRLWNRGGKKFPLRRWRRFYFTCRGTHEFRVDQIQLEGRIREIPLTPATSTTVARATTTPVIDGRLDDPCWAEAQEIGAFQTIDGSGPAREPTHCRVLWNAGTLFIAAEMETRHPERLRATQTRHDSAVYTDDAFEVFLARADDPAKFQQFAVNPAGTTMELARPGGLDFSLSWKAAARRYDKGWRVELAIPLEGMFGRVTPGTVFRLNAARENRVTGELSCWSPTGHSFLRPLRFGWAILGGDRPCGPLPTFAWQDYGGGVFAFRTDASALARIGGRLRFGTLMVLAGAAAKAEKEVASEEMRAGEVLVPLSMKLEREGTAQLAFRIVGRDSAPVAFGAYSYRVFLPLEQTGAANPLGILPTPKWSVSGRGTFRAVGSLTVTTAGGRLDSRVPAYLGERLEGFGIRMRRTSGPAQLRLTLLGSGEAPPGGSSLPRKARDIAKGLGPEGYVLNVEPEVVTVAARTSRGMFYGLLTFLEIAEQDTKGGGEIAVRCCQVVDKPSLPWRALTLSIPTTRWGYPNDAPVTVDFFCEFIDRYVVRHKLNTIVLLTRQGVKYDSHPEIPGPAAWSKAELRRFVEFCRSRFIRPIPLVDSYGHASWMTLSHKELWEDGYHHIACTRHPETWKILTDVYAELLQVFAPEQYFHIGLDEVWWKTLDVPEEKRCPRCAGMPKWKLLADHVRRIHDWFAERGVTIMMWSDMLLPEHNGGAPYHSARALPLLPKDIVQTNWSTSLAPDSNRRLHLAGFRVWQSNSRGVNREQAQYCEGNMFGAWSKVPWRTEASWRGVYAYSYLNFPLAAEYSWNLWPDVETMQPSLSRRWLWAHMNVYIRDAVDPVPRGGARWFTVKIPGNMSTRAVVPESDSGWFGAAPDRDLRFLPRGRVDVGGCPFDIPEGSQDCLAVRSPQAVVIPVERKAAELRFLHTAYLPADKEKQFYEKFKKPEFWRGVPLGEYAVDYADGTHAVFPVLYTANIRRWEVEDQAPFLYDAVGYLTAATARMKRQSPDGRDVCLYVAQWVNPHPDKTITRIVVKAGGGEAVPVLFAVTGREPRPTAAGGK